MSEENAYWLLQFVLVILTPSLKDMSQILCWTFSFCLPGSLAIWLYPCLPWETYSYRLGQQVPLPLAYGWVGTFTGSKRSKYRRWVRRGKCLFPSPFLPDFHRLVAFVYQRTSSCGDNISSSSSHLWGKQNLLAFISHWLLPIIKFVNLHDGIFFLPGPDGYIFSI